MVEVVPHLYWITLGFCINTATMKRKIYMLPNHEPWIYTTVISMKAHGAAFQLGYRDVYLTAGAKLREGKALLQEVY